jgi:DNA repair photolyase
MVSTERVVIGAASSPSRGVFVLDLFVLRSHPSSMVDERPDRMRKGRGAVSNRTGRYERLETVAVDDGWSEPEEEPVRTRLLVDTARSIITSNDSPDVPFDRSINPYRGCEHGCIYCSARPSHAWLGLSPGLDFETVLFHKPDAPALLEAALRKPGYNVAPMVLGSNTDPYQPIERTLELSRRILLVLEAFGHPITVVTKSALVLRDLDILARMASRRLAHVAVSLTTLQPALARSMEPRAAAPARRLEIVRTLSAAGVPVSVLISPIIPGLTDHEIERIVEAAAEAGACNAATVPVRLPKELGDLFIEWLNTHVPDRAARVVSLIRQMRDGALTQSEFGTRLMGTGPYARLIGDRHRRALARYGLANRWTALDTTQFRPPPAPGDQLSLF